MPVFTPRRHSARVSISLTALLGALAPFAHGADAQSNDSSAVDPTGTITLTRAIEAAMARNPDLAASAYEIRAAEARTQQARVRPNPELALELEDFGGSGDAQGIDELQSTLSLSHVLELGDKRGHRVEVASADRELTAIEQQARELDVLAEVTRRFIDVVRDQERLALARETGRLVAQTEREIAARVQAARTPQAELSRAQIASTRARLDERLAETELSGARRTLAAMWGGMQARFDSAGADLFQSNPLDSFERLLERIDRNPDFARFASEARLRDAQVRLAQVQARPNLTLQAGVRHYKASSDVGLVAGFSLQLPVFDRNQGAIAEARVRRQQSSAEDLAARVRAQAVLFALYQQLLTSNEQLATLRNEALPQAQAALEQTRQGYERGRFSYLELASAQQDLLSLRAAVIDTAADSHRLAAEIERLTREPVSAPRNPTGNSP